MAKIIFAGGGSAGHIEPALAVARVWKKNHPNDHCIFLGTAAGLENILIPAAGFELALIPKVRISRKPSFGWFTIPITLIKSVFAASRVLSGAHCLIGFGGYVSGPAYIAACLRKVTIVIHEANVKPGWANRLGSIFTDKLAVAHFVRRGKFLNALLTGLPLRLDVSQAVEQSKNDWGSARASAKLRLGFDLQSPLIAVIGGSQGSVAINDVISQAISPIISDGVNVVHAVGKLNSLPKSNSKYQAFSYIDNMADIYLAADLVISRSGAVTCSEFRALGRFALFIPLPTGNGEQFINANSLVVDRRAIVIEQKIFTAEYLLSQLPSLLRASQDAPIQGDEQDLLAAEKIVAFAEFAINS